MQAIKVTGAGHIEIEDKVPVPVPKDGEILVKIHYVALNPSDWKSIDYFGSSLIGEGVGSDYSGTVVSSRSRDWEVGDRIAGISKGCNAFDFRDGVFAESAVVRGELAVKIPEGVGDEEAATLGIGVSTAGLGLYKEMGLPLPGSVEFGEWVLVYGGSSATGSLAVQFAELSGAKVIATCSSRNFEFVRGLGAIEVFDYNEPGCAEKIRKRTDDQLVYVFDCIGGDLGSKICTNAIGSKGGLNCSIIPSTSYPRGDVRVNRVVAYSIFGEPFQAPGKVVPTMMEDHVFGKMFWRLPERLLAEGKIKTHPSRVGHGLASVFEGLDGMRRGNVSGQKLVYRVWSPA
ncbi:Hps1-dma1 cluster oxidoreductase toxD [Pseudocercospora fuligena]|uniref:Hps1-dma1 cluster oxidoreductase toxD n=1 Tax=Pseudocercospora fuligena TaxID=685502 RepID=A0A8H6RJX2_9PEZI|nr:Hps1-dma1 cluster oxidoreductase toxD [Pseudocercospora fuligena]